MQSKQSENAFYLITNPTLFSVALAQARHVARLWEVDVHVFLEDQPADKAPAAPEFDRVHLHINELTPHLARRMPETEKLPWVVFLRIAGPKVLCRYRRLIYIDTDVHVLRRQDALWDVELENGLGAVSDPSFLIWSDFDPDKVRERIAPRGLQGTRYFNSGVLLIDTESWNADVLLAGLDDYFARYAKAANFLDQDYLNYALETVWTELSPAVNMITSALDLGLGTAWPPVFLHFTGAYKPWSPFDPNYEGPAFTKMRELYGQLLNDADLPHPDTRKFHASRTKDIKSGIRRALASVGWQSTKERRVRQAAAISARALYDHIAARAQEGAYADVPNGHQPPPYTAPDFIFNGHQLRIDRPDLP